MNKKQPTDIRHHTFFYELLMSPEIRYRIGRHFLFILALFAVAFNQVYMGFIEYISILGVNIYIIALFILISYLAEGYFNIYVLIPKLFLKKQYTAYFVIFSFTILLIVIIHYMTEYSVFKLYGLDPGLFSYFKKQDSAIVLEFVASYFVDYIAIIGTGLTVILKHWLINNGQVSLLEKKYMQTEVEKLKEQVSPQFLFSILHEIGDITLDDQKKASDLLMELSEILRYQLYDCNRERVLLNAEIQYITTYLQIEKTHYGKMDFEIKTDGDMNKVFVSPLLFIPFVQNAVKDLQEENCYFKMQICFKSGDNYISFSCDCKNNAFLLLPDLRKIKQRLETLYNQRYVLKIDKKKNAELFTFCLYIKYLEL